MKLQKEVAAREAGEKPGGELVLEDAEGGMHFKEGGERQCPVRHRVEWGRAARFTKNALEDFTREPPPGCGGLRTAWTEHVGALGRDPSSK